MPIQWTDCLCEVGAHSSACGVCGWRPIHINFEFDCSSEKVDLTAKSPKTSATRRCDQSHRDDGGEDGGLGEGEQEKKLPVPIAQWLLEKRHAISMESIPIASMRLLTAGAGKAVERAVDHSLCVLAACQGQSVYAARGT